MKKIIIKIGSSVLFDGKNHLDIKYLDSFADQIKLLKMQGVGIVIVLSGAVAMGSNFINLQSGSTDQKKAAAGIGQVYIISALMKIFSKRKMRIAQLLLTKNTISTRNKKKAFSDLIYYYTESGYIPVINENDIDELNCFGGNDILAAKVAKIIKADQLLILSSWDGSKFGVGGARTKNLAMEILKKDCIISNIRDGKIKNIILNSVL